MSIKIGDNNRIKNSNIVNNGSVESVEKTVFGKHPYAITFGISLLAGFILLFSFWDTVVEWIESLWK